mgnify:CR=1 FL=1
MLRNSLIKRQARKSAKETTKKTKKTKKTTKKEEPVKNKRAVRLARPQKSDLRDGYYSATVVINENVAKFKSPLFITHEGKEIGYIYNLASAQNYQQSAHHYAHQYQQPQYINMV